MERKQMFKFRLYPNAEQKRTIDIHLEICRRIYNELLGIKIETYNHTGKSLGKYDLNDCLTQFKTERKNLKIIHSQVGQNVSDRIYKAFYNMFARIKRGEKAGFPRFKGKNRYKSITYTQSGFKFFNDKKLSVSKIGDINIKKHRDFSEKNRKLIKIKTMLIQKTPTGKYYAVFSCVVDVKPRKASNKSIGIDVGLKSFLATSEGTTIEHPKYYRKAEDKLAMHQRRLSRKKKRSNNRLKAKQKVALLHEKTANQRMDFIHKLSCDFAKNYGLIAIEDLAVKNMVKNHNLSKSINDSGWSLFANQLLYKAENAGCVVHKSDRFFPSTQLCSACGNRQDMPLEKRTYKCSCGLVMDRDINASKNLLNDALKNTAGTAGFNACGDDGVLSSLKQEATQLVGR